MTKGNQDSQESLAVKALVIACLTIAAAALLAIVEKSPLGMVLLLIVFVAAMLYPISAFTNWQNPKQSAREKRIVKALFVLVTMLAAGLMGYWFWPTPRIRVVSISPWEPKPGVPQDVNMYLRNDGRDARFKLAFRIFYVDRNFASETDRAEMEENLWQQFMSKPDFMPEQDILNGETTWLTFGHSPNRELELVLTPDQVTRLQGGIPCVYIMAQFRYVDTISERNLDFCEYFQKDVTVLPRCVHHNGVAKWPNW